MCCLSPVEWQPEVPVRLARLLGSAKTARAGTISSGPTRRGAVACGEFQRLWQPGAWTQVTRGFFLVLYHRQRTPTPRLDEQIGTALSNDKAARN